MKMPDYYKAPLRKRQEIVDWLFLEHKGRTYDYRYYPLVWDVKLYGLNLDLDHLIAICKENGEWHEIYDEYMDIIKSLYNPDALYELAVEAAVDGVNRDDTFKELWDGTPLNVEYTQIGRSGGHLAIERWECQRIDFCSTEAAYDFFSDMPYDELRTLYRLVVMLDHDWTREAACQEVEYMAVNLLFANWTENLLERIEGALTSNTFVV